MIKKHLPKGIGLLKVLCIIRIVRVLKFVVLLFASTFIFFSSSARAVNSETLINEITKALDRHLNSPNSPDSYKAAVKRWKSFLPNIRILTKGMTSPHQLIDAIGPFLEPETLGLSHVSLSYSGYGARRSVGPHLGG
jgi:hypothetical protein